MATARWSEYDTIKLIRLYKSYEFLWNKQTDMYRNIYARKQAYEAIVAEMDVPGLTSQDVRCKIKNLRTAYYQELRKMASHKFKNLPFKPLRWFSAFKSIMGNVEVPIKQMKMPDTREPQSESEELEEEEEQPEDSLFIEESTSNSDAYVVTIKQEFLDEMDNICDKSTPTTICDYLEPVSEPKRAQISVQQKPSDDNKIDEEMIRKSKCLDEFQIFANNIAQQLRKLPLSRALNLQVEVQRMIARERIEMLKKQVERKSNEEDST